MALFKSKLEKIQDLYDSLSDEEKAKFYDSITDTPEDDVATDKEDAIEDTEEKVEETEDNGEEVAEDEVEETETTEEPTEEETEDTEEPAPKEESVEDEPEEDAEETAIEEETEEDNQEEVEEVKDTRLDDLIEDHNKLKDIVQKLLDKFDILDEQDNDSEMGLGKQESIDMGEDEEDMSAHDYAMKYAKY